MNKKIISVLIVVINLILIYEILTDPEPVLDSVSFSFNIWKDNIFPSLFPFLFLGSLLISFGFVEFIGEILKPFMHKIFKIKGETAFVLILSMISGFPSAARYIKELYDNKTINDLEGTKLLTFTHFSNPLFILGTVSITFLNNKTVGLLIIIIHYLLNLIIGLIFRNYYISEYKNEHIDIKKAFKKMHEKRIKENFGNCFAKALKTSINTMLLILGVITSFLVITTIINYNIKLDDYHNTLVRGILEMTQGLKYASMLNISLKLKAVLSIMFISFGGFSVHMQVYSMISETKIRYYPYFIARIIHASCAGLLIYFLFDIFI